MAERWSVGLIGAIGAAAGGVSAAAASLLGGGHAFAGGTAVGVASGAIVAGTLFWAVRDQADTDPAAPTEPVGPDELTPLGEPAGSDSTNLTPLMRAVGARFTELAELQLDAVWSVGRTVGGAAPDELLAAERLARRTRRAAATLAVLADPDPDPDPDPDSELDPELGPGTGPGQDRDIAAVLDEALADSERRARVDRASVQEVTVRGRVAGDVAHLLAELIDNAAEASDETVTIVGRRSAEGYVLSVVDEGGGLSATARQDANRTLTSPPGLDRQAPTGLGLSAVGRLAARHGIGVQLLEAATDGIIAKVRLPAGVLDAAPVANSAPPAGALVHGGDHTEPSEPERPTPPPVASVDPWPEALATSIAEADGSDDEDDPDAAGPAGTVHEVHTADVDASPGSAAPTGRRRR